MAGLRADECAGGGLMDVLHACTKSCFQDFIAQTEMWLSAADFQRLSKEFELGRQFLELGLHVKVSFWSRLPEP